MKNTKSYPRLLLLLVFVAGISNIYSQSCPDELVSYWTMDDADGSSTLTDIVNGNNATLHNFTVDSKEGRVGNSNNHYFDEVSEIGQYADAPDNDIYSFPANSSFSISYWVKFTETLYGVGDPETEDHIIISKGDWNYGAPNTAFWASGNNGSGKISFMLRDDTDDKVDLEGRKPEDHFNDGNWHHVACVRNGVTDLCALYVDGRVTDDSIFDFKNSFDNSAKIYIGSLTKGGTPRFFYWGAIDELAIFKKALSKADIDEIIANGIQGTGLCNISASPVFNSTPVIKATVGEAYSYTAHAKGTQSGMTYTLLNKPTGMTINASTGAISWTPASINIDVHVQIIADNNIAPADTQSFTIYLTEGGVDCPSGLMTLHRLDEKSGTSYADFKEDHNAVVAPGYVTPTPTTGIIGGAQTFGANTGINIPDNGTEFDWAVNASFSLECWFKTTEKGKVALARNRTDAYQVTSWWIGVGPEGTGIIEARDNAHTNTVLKGTSLINDGEWHHVVGVRDGVANQNRIYVDGVLEKTLDQVFVDNFSAPGNLVVSIGYLTPWVGGESELHMLGSIDETAIFNRALTSQEIASFYNNGNPTGHCTSSNYAPVFTSTPVTAATEDAAYSYTLVVDDINSTDTLTLSVQAKPAWLNFSWTPGSKTAIISGIPRNADVTGNNSVTLRVTDNHIVRNQTFTIVVANTQDAPVITSTPVTSVNRGDEYSYTLTVTDVDVSDNITMEVVNKPTWLAFNWTANSKTATLTGTPGNAHVGINPVKISITDNHTTIYEEYNITVIQTNLAPVITGQGALSVDEDESITLQKSDLTITDADNLQSEIAIKVRPGVNYSFMNNTVTPAKDFYGSLTVNVRAYDPDDSSEVYPVNVTVIPVFDGPVITSTPDTSIVVDKPYIYIFTADVPSGSTLTKAALSKPSWLKYDATAGVLSGIPRTDNIGKHTVVMSASDGTQNVYQQFNIIVKGLVSITEAHENEFVLYPVPANNELNIRFNNLNDETTIDIINSTGSIVETMAVSAGTESTTVSLYQYEAGIYICHIRNNSINAMSRFMIVR